MKRFFLLLLFSGVLAGLLAGCAARTELAPEDAGIVLKPASFSDLPGWRTDRQDAAMAAFLHSCSRILRRGADEAFGPSGGKYGDWHGACRAAQALDLEPEDDSPHAARRFFESRFRPYAVYAQNHGRTGLFTGYFEPSLRGAASPFGPYRTPLRARPDDLVSVDLGTFREDLKGRRIAGRVRDGRLKPYETRAEIAGGALDGGKAEPLVWVDSPVDAFFLHIQGSGRVVLPDGETLRLGYAGQNGHSYYAIGRALVARGVLDRQSVSLQSIRRWLEANPDMAADIMNMNESYIFFRILEDEGPLGGEGVVLTPGRSLAVDRTRISYGVPVWLDAQPPLDGEAPVRRLMVAQDTGGAIRGPVRGDVFWGYGPEAERLAGHMKSKGRYWILLPKDAPARL